MSRRQRATESKADGHDEGGYYEAYVGFARELRVWFLAYGIGGPVVFLSHETALARLLSSGAGQAVAYAFLAGVAVQVVLALLYKSAMWYLYMGELDGEIKSSGLYRMANAISASYWLELLGDLVTLVLFAGATLRLLAVFQP